MNCDAAMKRALAVSRRQSEMVDSSTQTDTLNQVVISYHLWRYFFLIKKQRGFVWYTSWIQYLTGNLLSLSLSPLLWSET